jgi:hypothetical protein
MSEAEKQKQELLQKADVMRKKAMIDDVKSKSPRQQKRSPRN